MEKYKKYPKNPVRKFRYIRLMHNFIFLYTLKSS